MDVSNKLMMIPETKREKTSRNPFSLNLVQKFVFMFYMIPCLGERLGCCLCCEYQVRKHHIIRLIVTIFESAVVGASKEESGIYFRSRQEKEVISASRYEHHHVQS